MIRRVFAVAFAAAALGLAACGGSSKPAAPADPTAEALSYLPASAPVAALVDTDPEGGQLAVALGVIRRAPGSAALLPELQRRLGGGGTSLARLTPALGNPLVVGAATPAEVSTSRLTFAVVGRDADALKRGLAGLPGVREAGDYRGATLYRGPGVTYALDDATLVFAAREATVRAALDTHAGSRHLTRAQVDRALKGLPRPALVRVYGNVARLLSGPASAGIKQVTWIGALQTFGVAVRAEPAAAVVSFRATADPSVLEASDVPIATGPRAPGLRGAAPVRGGLRDLSHTLRFLQTLAARLAPAQFEPFDLAKTALRFTAGVDLDADLIDQFTGTTTLQYAGGRAVVQSDVRQPERVRTALTAIRPFVPRGLEAVGISGATVEPAGESGFDQVSVDGRVLATYGVAGGRFVAGNVDTAALVAALGDRADPLPGAQGALVGDAIAAPVRALLARFLPVSAAGGLGGLVGGGRGWVQASITGLRGEGTVDLNG